MNLAGSHLNAVNGVCSLQPNHEVANYEGHRSGDIGPSARRFDRRDDPLQSGPHILNIVLNVVGLSLIIALSASDRSFAAGQPSDVPPWLEVDVGDGE